jgi:hypothetical protein
MLMHYQEGQVAGRNPVIYRWILDPSTLRSLPQYSTVKAIFKVIGKPNVVFQSIVLDADNATVAPAPAPAQKMMTFTFKRIELT